MKKTFIHFLVCSLFFTGPVLADCSVPEAPAIPKGFTATSSEMQKAKEEIEGYIAEVREYVSCGVSNAQAQKVADLAKVVVNKFNMEYQAYITRS